MAQTRVARLVLVALIALAALGVRAPHAPAQDAEALDMPMMTLYPGDAAEAGLDDYRVSVGNLPRVDSQSFWISLRTRQEAQDYVDAIEAAGADEIYEMFLDRTADADDPNSELLSSIVTTVYAGDDEDGAEELFELMSGSWAGVAQEELETDSVGDASVLTVHDGPEPYLVVDAEWMTLTILAGTDVLSVALIDYSGEAPDPEVLQELGERLVERVEEVRAGDAPELANISLRLVSDDTVAYPRSFYLQIDGEAQTALEVGAGMGKYLETEPDNVERAEFFAEIGTTDVYFSQQQLRGGIEGGAQDYVLEVMTFRFEDEDAAEAYMAHLPDLLADADLDGFEEVDDAPRDGDEALAFIWEAELNDLGVYHHQITYVRDGDVIARVAVMGVEPTEEGAAILGEAQAECLAERDCTEQLETPEELLEE